MRGSFTTLYHDATTCIVNGDGRVVHMPYITIRLPFGWFMPGDRAW